MTCEACREAREVDEIVPDCETAAGCIIPPLAPAGARVMELWGLINRLHEYGATATILERYEVTKEELELLAVVAGEVSRNESVPGGRNEPRQ